MSRREVIDVCLFAGEREMLELRFRTLAPHVEHFVAVACTRSHQGQPIDFNMVDDAFWHAASATGVSCALYWFSPRSVLVRHGRAYERPVLERGAAGTPWFQHIERQHRNACAEAVVQRVTNNPAAIVMVSDVDEIPSEEACVRIRAGFGADPAEQVVMAQRFHSTCLNLLHPQQPWFGTCAALLGHLNPQAHRDARTTIGTAEQSVTVMDHAGWHFSWFGSDAERARKLDTFSHAELRGKFDVVAGRREHQHSNGEQLRQLSVAETWEMDWPTPLLDDSFVPPEWWLTEDAWRPQ